MARPKLGGSIAIRRRLCHEAHVQCSSRGRPPRCSERSGDIACSFTAVAKDQMCVQVTDHRIGTDERGG